MVRAPGSEAPHDRPVRRLRLPSYTVALNGQGEIVLVWD